MKNPPKRISFALIHFLKIKIDFHIGKEWNFLNHCNQIKIHPIISPFSFKAVELCQNLGVSSLKLGSGETSNIPLIKYAASRSNEIILSTGMSGWFEIDKVIEEINSLNKKNLKVIVLQCTSKYPTNLEDIGIENIKRIF